LTLALLHYKEKKIEQWGVGGRRKNGWVVCHRILEGVLVKQKTKGRGWGGTLGENLAPWCTGLREKGRVSGEGKGTT